MTNFEYYKDEIKALGYEFAVVEGTNEIKPCRRMGNCAECLFKGDGRVRFCTEDKIKWLYEEHKEQPKLTKNARKLCEILRDGYVKNYLDDIVWSKEKDGLWWILPTEVMIDCNFSFIKEDKKMWSVEDLLKLEVIDAK